MGHKLVETRYKVCLPGRMTWEPEVTVQWPHEPGYDLIKSVVVPILGDRHDLEHVSVWASYDDNSHFCPLDMFVDENGMSFDLARNERATTIYRQAVMMGKVHGYPIPSDPEQLNWIVGPAVLFHRRIWF